jgi:hypothetical protein
MRFYATPCPVNNSLWLAVQLYGASPPVFSLGECPSKPNDPAAHAHLTEKLFSTSSRTPLVSPQLCEDDGAWIDYNKQYIKRLRDVGKERGTMSYSNLLRKFTTPSRRPAKPSMQENNLGFEELHQRCRMSLRDAKASPLLPAILQRNSLTESHPTIPLFEAQSSQAVEERLAAELEKQAAAESERMKTHLKLVFLTGDGELTIWASRSPLGVKFGQGVLPMTVSGVTAGGHAEELGIQQDWILKCVDHTDVYGVREFDQGFGILLDGTKKFAQTVIDASSKR